MCYLESQFGVHRLFEIHWGRPRPLAEHQEEFLDNGARCSIGVQLASAGNQEGPWHAPQVPQHIAVHTVPWDSRRMNVM